MTYFSPLHIFDGQPVNGVDDDSLKRLRKELLLQFDLKQQTTLELNGREYDKAGVLAVFDQLKGAAAEHHLRLYRNQGLLRFLEAGDMRFFEDKKKLGRLE